MSVYIKYKVIDLHILPYTLPVPTITVTSTNATSISLSLSVPSDSVVTSYEVMWQRDTSVGCSDEDEGSSTINTDRITTNYNISGRLAYIMPA